MLSDIDPKFKNAVKSMTCQHCNRSFYQNNLKVYSYPCSHLVCSDGRNQRCRQCRDADFRTNEQQIDYGMMGLLQSSSQVELDEKSLEPKNIRILMYLMLAWLLIIIGLTVATLVASHFEKNRQAQFVMDANKCIPATVSRIFISNTSGADAARDTTGRLYVHSGFFSNLWDKFKDKFKSLKNIVLEGLGLTGKALQNYGKKVFHSVEQVVVNFANNMIGDLGMINVPDLAESIVDLSLAQNGITDQGLENMNGQYPPALEILNLNDNSITSAGLCGFGNSLKNFVSKASKHILKLDMNPIKQEYADLIKNGKKQFACAVGQGLNNAFCNFTINLGEFGDILVKNLFKCS